VEWRVLLVLSKMTDSYSGSIIGNNATMVQVRLQPPSFDFSNVKARPHFLFQFVPCQGSLLSPFSNFIVQIVLITYKIGIGVGITIAR
jgi:hypothetical protein